MAQDTSQYEEHRVLKLLEVYRGLYKPGQTQWLGIQKPGKPWAHIGARGRHKEARNKTFLWFINDGWLPMDVLPIADWREPAVSLLNPEPAWLRPITAVKHGALESLVYTLVQSYNLPEPDPLPDEAVEFLEQWEETQKLPYRRETEFQALHKMVPQEERWVWAFHLSRWGYLERATSPLGRWRLGKRWWLRKNGEVLPAELLKSLETAWAAAEVVT